MVESRSASEHYPPVAVVKMAPEVRVKLENNTIVDPPPIFIAEQITEILNSAHNPRVILLHADTMYAGKSTALNELARMLPLDSYMAFQPAIAVRNEDQKNSIIDRNGGRTSVNPLQTNDLGDIVKYLENLDAKPTYVLIDELMLFIGNADNHEDAVLAIEAIRGMGMHLVIAGINYTFKGEDFTFMREMALEVVSNPNWHHIRMQTLCNCGRPAKVSARLVWRGGVSCLASYSDGDFLASDEYAPRCNEEGHVGCTGHPNGNIMDKWPI